MECRICGNKEIHTLLEIREMRLGVRDFFNYFECTSCGCLQISDFPYEIEKYYSNSYYSPSRDSDKRSIIDSLIKKRDKYIPNNRGLIRKIINIKHKNPLFEEIALNGNSNSRILDIGCGKGELLYYFRELGFTNLYGIDPFIDHEINEEHITIKKDSIESLSDNKFDFIFFNHSFEHIFDEVLTLYKVHDILNDKGLCVISIPVKTEYIWNLYGKDWVQIDAPRHFYLHTLKSFQLLAEKTLFTIRKIIFNSTAFQFWGSEQYKRNIHLNASNSYFINPEKSIFSKKDIVHYTKSAKNLNKNQMGDQASFFIKKTE